MHCNCLLLGDGPGSVGTLANVLILLQKVLLSERYLRGQYALGLYLVMGHKTSMSLKELNFYGHLMRIV